MYGLEYALFFGVPERRWEFWNNKAHSVLAFGSAVEARARLEHFVTEVRGTAPRVALAGWFQRTPDYLEITRQVFGISTTIESARHTG